MNKNDLIKEAAARAGVPAETARRVIEKSLGIIGDRLAEGDKVIIKDFGTFVEILPGMDGLCHISEFSDKFLKSMDGVCKVGDIIKVKCLDVDERGRIKLSRKAAMAELDEQAAK